MEANWPEKMAARLGAQKTPAVWALLKLTPLLASLSMLGVMARGVLPRQPIQSFMSSTARKRMLGLSLANPEKERREARKNKNSLCVIGLGWEFGGSGAVYKKGMIISLYF